MKNLPYLKGGTCEKEKNTLSFSGNLKPLQFETFEEFCERADEILYVYTRYKKQIKLVEYKEYIYSKKLHENKKLDNAMKDKCFEWIMSLDYDDISINDLYSLLGLYRKGKKWDTNLKK